MAPTLYITPSSPPSRAVLMAAKYLNLELECKFIDFFTREQLSPEFLKINPQHTVPTLIDEDGFIMCDSHAIMQYLIEKYGGGDDSLYPSKDYRKRAVINQRLHFENEVFLPRSAKVLLPMFGSKSELDPAVVEAMNEAYGFLEKFLENGDYVAGDSLSIADLSLIACVSLDRCMRSAEYGTFRYPKIEAWYQRIEALPCYAVNIEMLALAVYKITQRKTMKKRRTDK